MRPEEDPIPITLQDAKTRSRLGRKFLEEVVFGQMRQLQTWKTVTNQTSQFDSGYLAQQLTSILSGIPGTALRGRGDDLADGSEVKAANTVQATDTPRWNHSLKRRDQVDSHLSKPSIFYVLFDTVERDDSSPIRCRIWKVSPSTDHAYQVLVEQWDTGRGATTYNMQIQPPRWDASNIASCFGTRLALPLFFHAEQRVIGGIDYVEVIAFNEDPGQSTIVDGEVDQK